MAEDTRWDWDNDKPMSARQFEDISNHNRIMQQIQDEDIIDTAMREAQRIRKSEKFERENRQQREKFEDELRRIREEE